jgi:hypothetical protein
VHAAVAERRCHLDQPLFAELFFLRVGGFGDAVGEQQQPVAGFER